MIMMSFMRHKARRNDNRDSLANVTDCLLVIVIVTNVRSVEQSIVI